MKTVSMILDSPIVMAFFTGVLSMVALVWGLGDRTDSIFWLAISGLGIQWLQIGAARMTGWLTGQPPRGWRDWLDACLSRPAAETSPAAIVGGTALEAVGIVLWPLFTGIGKRPLRRWRPKWLPVMLDKPSHRPQPRSISHR